MERDIDDGRVPVHFVQSQLGCAERHVGHVGRGDLRSLGVGSPTFAELRDVRFGDERFLLGFVAIGEPPRPGDARNGEPVEAELPLFVRWRLERGAHLFRDLQIERGTLLPLALGGIGLDLDLDREAGEFELERLRSFRCCRLRRFTDRQRAGDAQCRADLQAIAVTLQVRDQFLQRGPIGQLREEWFGDVEQVELGLIGIDHHLRERPQNLRCRRDVQGLVSCHLRERDSGGRDALQHGSRSKRVEASGGQADDQRDAVLVGHDLFGKDLQTRRIDGERPQIRESRSRFGQHQMLFEFTHNRRCEIDDFVFDTALAPI